MEAYSTATVHKRERVEYWQDLCSRTYADLELSPRDHRTFEGELRRSCAGPFSLVDVTSSAAQITRSQEHVSRSSARRVEIFLTLRGESVCLHHGRRAVLKPGDFVLVDLALPYRFEFEDTCRAISIGMPESFIQTYLPVPGPCLGRVMSGRRGVNRLASDMIQCLCEQVQSGQLTEIGPTLARGMLDVVAAAYVSSFGRVVSGSAAAAVRRVQIRAFIEANLRDPRLAPAHIASNLGISSRYLRLLFSQEQETISRYVARRRLEEATRELTDTLWQGTSITEIAYHWGFSDAAHFARLFRERFGTSPRSYRQEHLCRG